MSRRPQAGSRQSRLEQVVSPTSEQAKKQIKACEEKIRQNTTQIAKNKVELRTIANAAAALDDIKRAVAVKERARNNSRNLRDYISQISVGNIV